MPKPELSLHDTMLAQARACAELGSTMYVEILEGMAADLATGGVIRDLTEGLTLRPTRDAVPLRILGAVHREVLAGNAPRLAAHYPSTGGTPGAALIRDFLATVDGNRAAVMDGLGRTVQTNEVGRTTMLVTGLAHFGRAYGVDEFHFREVGSSSGLNVLFDRFHFTVGGNTFGDPASPVRFGPDAWGEPVVDISRCPRVASRGGCDIAPLDIRDPDRRLTLLSFVWPDQRQRFERLHAALDIASSDPAYTAPVQADAAEWIDDQLTRLPDEPTVVFHSIVWQYFSQETKDNFRTVLRSHAARRRAPLAWLRMEPAGPVPDLRISTWINGTLVEDDVALATSSYHGIGARRL